MKSKEINELIKKMNKEVVKEQRSALNSITKLKAKKEVQKVDLLKDLDAIKRRTEKLSVIIKGVDEQLTYSRELIRSLNEQKKKKKILQKTLQERIKELTGVGKTASELKREISYLKEKKLNLKSKKDKLLEQVAGLRIKLTGLRDSLSKADK